MKFIASVLLLATVQFVARGATSSSNPTADAFVSTGPGGTLSGNNYGGGGAFSLSAPGLPQGELQSVLQFMVMGGWRWARGRK